VSLSWCESHNIQIKPLEFGQQNTLWAANSSALHVHGTILLELRIKGLIFPHEFLVISQLSDNVICGTDFMERYRVTLDYARGCVQLDDLINVPLASKESRQRIVRTTNSFFVPPYSEALIPVTVHKRFIAHNILLEAPPTHQYEKFATARTIVKPTSVNTICRILNHQSYPIVLHRRECLAIVSDVFTDNDLNVFNNRNVNRLSSELSATKPAQQSRRSPSAPPTRDELDVFLRRTGIKLADKAPADERYKVAALLFEFQDLFKTSVKDIKQCNVPPFEIKLRSDKGAFTRQYKLSAEDSKEISKQVDEMLKAKVIEPSTGVTAQHFNAPCFVISKRGTNAKRLVLDYRKLNQIIEPVILNLPPVNDLVADVSATKPKWMSSCDIISFFWQLPLAESSRPYTTFTAPSGQKFRYTTCPFGYSNSPAFASLALLSVLDRLKGRIAYYVDDILIATQTVTEHIDTLRDLFTDLRKANLSLNAKKCTFLDDNAVFLSHHITSEGYTLVPKYSTDIIRNWGSPQSARALTRWLNAAGWFRRHFPAFSKRTAPLWKLLKPDIPFVWTETHEKIFREINESIIKPPILRPLDNSSPVYILTDSSNEGCAYMIAQKGPDNKFLPCLFGGQSLTKAQAAYPIFQLEILALIQALHTHYNILTGREIIAITDNATLHHFNSLHLGTPRLRRWATLLSQYSISICHLKGKLNTLLDAISRQFSDMTPAVRLQFTPQENDTDDYILRVTDRTDLTDSNDIGTTDSYSHRDTDFVLNHLINTNEQTHHVTPQTSNIADITAPPSTQFTDITQNDHSLSSLNPDAQSFNPTESNYIINSVSTRKQNKRKTAKSKSANISPINTDTSDNSDATNVDQNQTPANEHHMTLDQDTEADSIDVNTQIDAEKDLNLTLADYETDPEFSSIIDYKLHGILTGNDATDRKILFTADSYFIMNNKLYRVTEPRRKRTRNVSPVQTRLCIPRKFQLQTVENYHKLLNHAGHTNLLETLRPRIYFQNLPLLCLEIPKTCDRCNMTKRNQSVPRQPLHPREVNAYNSTWHIDHLKLARPTSPSGFRYIFVAIEQFSTWPEAALCYSTDAKESALRLMETVISRHGLPETIVCDRATSFHNHLFEHLSKLLNVKISMSAARNPAGNSKVERQIAQIKQAIKVHIDSDPDIETVLPSILLGLRVTRTRSTDTTPFYLSRGFHPSLPVLGSGPDDPSSPQTTLTSQDKDFLTNLTKNMRELHENVKQNVVQYKAQMKQQYDKEWKTKPAPYKVGSKVWLENPQIKAGSKTVLSHKPWVGPYFVTHVHSPTNGNGGETYLLTHCETGRNHPHPVSALRIKPAHSREALIDRLYPEKAKSITMAERTTDNSIEATSQIAALNQSKQSDQLPAGYEAALRITKQRKLKGKLQFLVTFRDNSKYWCDANDCSEPLIKHFRILQAKRRNSRRKALEKPENERKKVSEEQANKIRK